MTYDYLSAAAGGALIGLAAVIVMLTHGKIMGLSGIISQILPPAASDWAWRVVFLGGVLIASPVFLLITGDAPPIELNTNTPILLIAGFMVGIGTVTGNGCTSGHGVCGLARLSSRSTLAVIVFILAAMATVYITRHVIIG